MPMGMAATLKIRSFTHDSKWAWEPLRRRTHCGVHAGEDQREQRQAAAQENHAEADQLVAQVGAVGGDAPRVVEGDLQRFEDAIGGNQQQQHGDGLKGAPQWQIALQECGQVAGEVVVHGQVDGVHGGGPAEHVAAEGEHHVEEGVERKQEAGGYGEGVDVDFSLHAVAQRETPGVEGAGPATGRRGGKEGSQDISLTWLVALAVAGG